MPSSSGVPGEIQSISAHSSATCTKVAVSANNSGNKRNGADTLLHFEVTDEVVKGKSQYPMWFILCRQFVVDVFCITKGES